MVRMPVHILGNWLIHLHIAPYITDGRTATYANRARFVRHVARAHVNAAVEINVLDYNVTLPYVVCM